MNISSRGQFLLKATWRRLASILMLLFFVDEGGAMELVELQFKVIDRNGALKEERTGKLPGKNFILGQSWVLQNGDHLLIGLKTEDVGSRIPDPRSTQQWFREGNRLVERQGDQPPVLLVRMSNSLSTRWSREFRVIGPPSGAVQIEGDRAYVLTSKDVVEEIDLSHGKTVRAVPLGVARFEKLVNGTNEMISIDAKDIVNRWLVSADKVIYGDRFLQFYPPAVVGKSDVTIIVDYIGQSYEGGSVYLVDKGRHGRILVVSRHEPVRRPYDSLAYARIALYRPDGSRIWEEMLGKYRTTTHWFGSHSNPRGVLPDLYLIERRRMGRTSVNQEWLDSNGRLYLAYETYTSASDDERYLKRYLSKIGVGMGVEWTTGLEIGSSLVTMGVCEAENSVWIVSGGGDLLRLDSSNGMTIVRKNLPLDNAQSLSSSCAASGDLNLFYTSRQN